MSVFRLENPLPALTAGIPVSFELGFGGYTPWSFVLTAGTVPVGLSFDPVTGILSGTPQVPGPYDFTITGTDSSTPTPTVSTFEYTGTISAPTVSATLGALEAGEPLVPYNVVGAPAMPYQLAVPYSSIINAGTLPDGLDLNSKTATLSGTPTTPGPYDFTVQVTDANGVVTTVEFTGTITGILLVVEDGSVVLGANSYLSISQANAILSLEPLDLTTWNALSATRQAQYLIAATRWLDDKVIYTGDRTTDPRHLYLINHRNPPREQPLGWPRRGAQDRERHRIREDIVPQQITRCTALVANYLLTSNDEDETQAGIRRFRSDTFEIEYQQGWWQSPAPPWLKFALFGLGQPANEIGFKKIRKA